MTFEEDKNEINTIQNSKFTCVIQEFYTETLLIVILIKIFKFFKALYKLYQIIE